MSIDCFLNFAPASRRVQRVFRTTSSPDSKLFQPLDLSRISFLVGFLIFGPPPQQFEVALFFYQLVNLLNKPELTRLNIILTANRP